MFAHAAVGKGVDARDQSVEEFAVVADQDYGAVELAYGFLEHLLRAHVEVVRGLVEDEQVHGLEQQFYHGQAGALAAGEHLYLLLRFLASKHEGAQNVANLQADVAPCHTVDGVEDR